MKSISPITDYFSSYASLRGDTFLFLRQGDDDPARFCICLVDLRDLEQRFNDARLSDHLLSHLSSREKEFFNSFRFAKRKREWLGGRLTAKYATFMLLELAVSMELFADVSILPGKNGSPVFSSSLIPANRLPSLSISHSGNFAVAIAAASKSCGIDIQQVSDKTRRVADRFCAPHEEAYLKEHLPQLKEAEQLTLLWSAKEAVKKSLLHDQPHIFQGVVLQSLKPGQLLSLHLQLPDVQDGADIIAFQLEDYMLSYTIAGTSNA